MTDEERIIVNERHLAECHPEFRRRLAMVLERLQVLGERPRIQQAWRSPEDQIAAFTAGRSKLKWGFHNATGPDGSPDALAADVLDDNAPLNPSRAYLLALAREARGAGLTTGLDWGLPTAIKVALTKALVDDVAWDGKIGWDPCHVETTGVTVTQARAGIRPVVPVSDGALRA